MLNENFKKELKDLLNKYGYFIESEADAADDSGLWSRVIITESDGKTKYGRNTVWADEELPGDLR